MFQKFIKLFIGFFLRITFLLLLLFCKLLKPIVYFKFGIINFVRIGDVYYLDWYLSEKKIFNQKAVDVFFHSDFNNIANKQWKKMWSRIVFLIYAPHSLFSFITILSNYNFFKDHIIKNLSINFSSNNLDSFVKNREKIYIVERNKRLNCVLNNRKPNIFFTKEEIEKGQNLIENLGIPKKSKFVCIHNRDSEFLNKKFPERDWSYHDYRDFKISDFYLTINKLIERNYYVVRMGSIVKEKANFYHPQFIDYPFSDLRSDFLDIFISSQCEYFVCSDSGISAVPEIFKVPVVFVNKTSVNHVHRWTHEGLFIFKKFYFIPEKRYLSFDEMLKMQLNRSNNFQEDKSYLMKMNIKLESNTELEIMNAALEMDDYLNNNITYSSKEEELQSKYWDILYPNNIRSNFFRIGNDFLINNKELF